jgi:hypothetical protein
MSVVHFQCPSCQAPLRLENRALFVGRMFDCPDCAESLLIEADGSTGVKAKRSHTPARRASERIKTNNSVLSRARRASVEAASKVSDLGVDLQSPQTAWDRLSRRPVLLGWIVAALFAVVLLIVVNSGRQPELSPADTPVVAEKKIPAFAPQEPDEQNSKTVVEPDPALPPANDKSPDATAFDAAMPKDNSEPLTLDVAKDSPLDSKPPTAEKPTAEEAKPVPIPPPPEPATVSLVLSVEAIEAKLQQNIVRFEQPKPIAFVKLLDTVEELAGVPIVWDLDRVADEQLQKPVTIRLKETTVAEILDTLLKQVGLERQIAAGKIELRSRTEPEPQP